MAFAYTDDDHHSMLDHYYEREEAILRDDEERDECIEWLHDQLPWLTHAALDDLCSSDNIDFPGYFATRLELNGFVERVKAASSSYQNFRLFAHGVEVGVSLDLVTGDCRVRDDGRWVPCELDAIDARFKVDGERYAAITTVLRCGRAQQLYARDIRQAVEQLAKKRLLAPVKYSAPQIRFAPGERRHPGQVYREQQRVAGTY